MVNCDIQVFCILIHLSFWSTKYWERYLKSLTTMVDLSIISCSFVNFYFICFEASFLGAQNLKYFIFLANQRWPFQFLVKFTNRFVLNSICLVYFFHLFTFSFSESLCLDVLIVNSILLNFSFWSSFHMNNNILECLNSNHHLPDLYVQFSSFFF